MTFEKSVFYTRGTVSGGAVSVSLNDSWTGKKLLEALGGLPPQRLSPEGIDVSEFFFSIIHFITILHDKECQVTQVSLKTSF